MGKVWTRVARWFATDIRMTFSLSPRVRLVLAVLAISNARGRRLRQAEHVRQHAGGRSVDARAHRRPRPSIIERRALPQNVSTLQEHAELYGRLLTTTPVLQNVARHAGVPASELSGLARITIPVPVTLTQPDSELRASQIVDSRAQYRLEMQASPGEPILTIYSQAPSPQAAVRLANAAVLGLQDYLRALAHQQGFAESKLPVLRALGAPRGGRHQRPRAHRDRRLDVRHGLRADVRIPLRARLPARPTDDRGVRRRCAPPMTRRAWTTGHTPRARSRGWSPFS
jgi:hypothetical protein